MARIVPDMHQGGITNCGVQAFTKEEFMKIIELNFPDNLTFENIATITTVASNDGVFQQEAFGMVLDCDKAKLKWK